MIYLWSVALQISNTVLPLLLTCHGLCAEFSRPQEWGLSDSLWTCLHLPRAVFILGLAVTATVFLWAGNYICAGLLLLIFVWYYHSFYIENSNKQLFRVRWQIYDCNLIMWCGEIYASYNSTGLEKWEHRMQHREVRVWDDKRWGTG